MLIYPGLSCSRFRLRNRFSCVVPWKVLCLRGGVEARRLTTLGGSVILVAGCSLPPLLSVGEFVNRSDVWSLRTQSNSHPADWGWGRCPKGWISRFFAGDGLMGEDFFLLTGGFLSVFLRLGGLVQGGPFFDTLSRGLVWSPGELLSTRGCRTAVEYGRWVDSEVLVVWLDRCPEFSDL